MKKDNSVNFADSVKKADYGSPIGRAAEEVSLEFAVQDPVYKRIREERAPFQEIAWLLIKYRMDHGLTQEELAHRVGTSSSQIARIESGRHATTLTTLRRVAHALDMKLVIGFEEQVPATKGRGARHKQENRELVAM